MPNKDVLKLQQRYLPGTRVQLSSLDSANNDLHIGDKGTIKFVDDSGKIIIEWDNGINATIDTQKDNIKRLSIDEQILEAENTKAEIIAYKQRKRDSRGRSEEGYEDFERG